MRALLFERPNLAQAAILSVLTLAAVALLASALAYWTWVWFAPRAEPRVEAAPVHGGSIATAGTIFGVVPPKPGAPVPTGVAIRLLGVVAATTGRVGHAVVQLDSKEILAVHEGEDFAPGIRLAEVHPDHVILDRSGVRETLAWPKRGRTATPVSRTESRTENE